MTHYFISDLHLSDKRPDLIRAFTSLSDLICLKQHQEGNIKLSVVGDFYEAWIGDDFTSSWNDDIEAALIKLSHAGVKLRVFHGNRDFLLGQLWANRVQAELIEGSFCLSHNAQTILISHGDEACLDDVEYQAFRSMVRQGAWQKQVLSMPLENRIALASKLREDSKSSNSEKMLDIMDVHGDEIKRLMTLHNAKVMIHGHTHRPDLHKLSNGSRLVLGDWDKFAWLSILDETGLSQYKFDVNELSEEKNDLDSLLAVSKRMHVLKI
ncbi:UDP-2,3-diacylglucosamine hydrolase [Marinomonas sp. MED121]|uniref:UDP-2,3-diacylglucosamine diphosphatase n=1 Tax=Marinomonas sp. MED121 TaxID=314277 RepID=UPI000069058E|nr:UDP-2,3-diacylglucosamine diphosphatase [Marinomonas sp. MED121]EAQ63613.1 UDP-2,3-diacylglucosamine hydrolase [Marinomonas sp. MED121]